MGKRNVQIILLYTVILMVNIRFLFQFKSNIERIQLGTKFEQHTQGVFLARLQAKFVDLVDPALSADST
jgi:hypothetical protein